jgi:hypothetical protein
MKIIEKEKKENDPTKVSSSVFIREVMNYKNGHKK